MDRIINSTKEMKQRIIYIDNLKALAIFTVVIGHVFYFTWNQYCNSIWNHLSYMLGIWSIIKIMAQYIPENIYNLFCLNQVANYILFFWGGFLTWKNKEKFFSMIKMKLEVIYALCFLIFGVAFYFCYYSGYETTGLFRKIMALFTIPILLILFRKVTFNEKMQKICSYVGTHSLEIYVLQYFFLPTTYSLGNSVMGG